MKKIKRIFGVIIALTFLVGAVAILNNSKNEVSSSSEVVSSTSKDLSVTSSHSTVVVKEGNDIVPAGANTLYSGRIYTITATPETYYNINSITLNGETFQSGGTWTCDGNCSIVVSTSAITKNLSITSTNATVIVSNSGTNISVGTDVLECNKTYTITVTPAIDYGISTLTLNGQTFENGGTWTCTDNCAIVVTTEAVTNYLKNTSWVLKGSCLTVPRELGHFNNLNFTLTNTSNNTIMQCISLHIGYSYGLESFMPSSTSVTVIKNDFTKYEIRNSSVSINKNLKFEFGSNPGTDGQNLTLYNWFIQNAYQLRNTVPSPGEIIISDLIATEDVSYNLTNCFVDSSFNEGVYTATITADEGYTLTGGTVTVEMGGVDITSTAYSNGVITISNLTDEVEITATAILDINTLNTWTTKTWSGATNLYAQGIAVLDDTIYQFYPDNYLVYDGTTWSSFEYIWENGYDVYGYGIWTDGVDYYYGSNNLQNGFVIDVDTLTFSSMTWNFDTAYYRDVTPQVLFQYGTDTYLFGFSHSCKLNVSTHTFEDITINGGVSIDHAFYLWTDGTNYYYSYNGSNYIFDVDNLNLTSFTMTGIDNFTSARVFHIGSNTYYTDLSNNTYIFDSTTKTWSEFTWYGLPSDIVPSCDNVWTDGTNYYLSSGTTQYVLSGYTA